MKIEIINGVYTRDDEAAELLTSSEEEFVAALAPKLLVRQERKKASELKAQEKLPTVRQLAAEAGVNTMTVNKAYQILKAEGYIKIDRRHGAVVADVVDMDLQFREKLEAELELLSAEASITGMEKAEFLKLCDGIYSKMKVCRQY